jgi:hypothetical protein
MTLTLTNPLFLSEMAVINWLPNSTVRFPTGISRSATNQDLFHTIATGIPCFLLVDCYSLRFSLVNSVALGVIGYWLLAHFLHSNGKWKNLLLLA